MFSYKHWTRFEDVPQVFIDTGTYEWRFKWGISEGCEFHHVTEGGARDSLWSDCIEAFSQQMFGESYDDANMSDAERDDLNNRANWSIRCSANKWQTVTGRQLFFITVYEIDRVYLGPEEGGRWGDVGEVVMQTTASSLDQAEAYRDVLRKKYPHTGTSSSVVYSGGDYSITIDVRPGEDYAPTHTHYE